jgi:putative addiction module antidote
MHALKLTPIGDEVGVILPKEVMERLKLENGDTLFLTELPDGLRLTAHRQELDEQLAIGRAFMQEYHDSFQELAK